jgi:hypothetical protein
MITVWNILDYFMSKKKTSFNLESSLLKDLKIKAVHLETTQTELIEKYIREGL